MRTNQSPQARAGCYDLPPSVTEVGGLEHADVPRRVECGGGAVVGNPDDNFWWDSVAWLPEIPKGAERSFGVLFERGF